MSDLVDLIHATVRLEQLQPAGSATIGTGFVVHAPDPDGSSRAILITARHVFESMPRDNVKVGFRSVSVGGDWRYAPVNIRIRGARGQPLWTSHPTQDVAAIPLPSGVAPAAVSAARLARGRALARLAISPGEEMMVLGYPQGYSANDAGFPILRAGRVASYPLTPPARYPTYLLDFSVFAGNSGGPVYVVRSGNGRPAQFTLTGIVTQELRLKRDRLEIGNVTHAEFVGETLELLGAAPAAEATATDGVLPRADPRPAAGVVNPSDWDRLREGWDTLVTDMAILLERVWTVVKQRARGWAGRAPSDG
jgi:hypothetical protein